MDSFLKQVKATIDEFSMLEDGESVLVGLSGGADSVALLYALKNLGYNVRACHLNHCLRGDEADRDENFCKRLCEKLNIPFVSMRKNIAEYAEKSKKSIETTAREVRYSFFNAQKQGGKIATAHTASDTIETMLFHLARGTGLTGICGIPPVRDDIIRPIIACTRLEVEDYLRRINQDYVTDSTNLTDEYTRNRIRNQIVPILKQINPKAEKAAVGLSFRLINEEDFLEKTANEKIQNAKFKDGWLVCEFNNAHKAVKQRMLKNICKISKVPMHEFTSKHVQALESLIETQNPSARISLPSGFIAKREYEILKIERETDKTHTKNNQILLKTLIDKDHAQTELKISIRKYKKNNLFYKTFNTFYVCCDTIDMQSCVLRTRQTGDKIRLTQNGGSKTLKKLMIEKKIPSEKRDSLVVIADKYGIIAVESIGIDISRKATGEDILEIKFKG